jgi:hypothetical protein
MSNNYGRVISAWSNKSSSGNTTYETQLHEDGLLTCDCPGWCIQKKDKRTGLPKPRSCKHTVPLANLAREIKSGRHPKVFQSNKPTTIVKIVERQVTEPTTVIRTGKRLLRAISE